MDGPSQEHANRFSASLTEDGRYRLLVEAVTDYAIYMLDITGIVTSWNAGAERFKGYRHDEIIGRHFSRFYTAEDQETGLPARALATAASEGRFEDEGWRVRKDGTRFWASVVIDAIRDPAKRVVAFAKITRDLTERRLAEDALRRSEEQFRHLVQGVIDYSIYLLEPDGKIGSWNAGAQRIKGYLPNEILGQHFSRFYTEEDQQAGLPARALATAAAVGKFEGEGWRVRKDGTQFWASVVIDALHDDHGKHIGFAKITRDITERRDAQLSLDRAREALFQSQKMEALGQLTGGVAHDFNNLLTVILGNLELARKHAGHDPRLARLIDSAFHGAERGAALTRRMLAFARRQDLNLEALDLPTLVRGMTELLERSLGASIAVAMRFPSDLAWVRADPNQLEMAILNLALNARDAMTEGGALVLEASEQAVPLGDLELEPGPYICLSVTDTGCGMDDATLARAREPFFTTKEVGKGTGLGLSTVYGLAAQSGGQLVLKSRPGAGTTAEIWLPVAPKPEDRATEIRADQPPIEEPSFAILAIDDDDMVLANTLAMLQDLGHTVFAANSGAAALATLRLNKLINLVITDQLMPGMTGLQLIAAMKAEWPDLPAILATGYAEIPPDEASVLRLAKPFLQRDLSQAIGRAMIGRVGDEERVPITS
jgi:PAS domain S-box-containing protein